MKDFDQTTLIGVIFDLTISHSKNGQRNIDIIKDSLVKKVLDQKEQSKIYVAHPDWHVLPRDQGESTYYIATYKEPQKFSIDTLFRNTVTLIGQYAEDCEKYIILFTDRFSAPINYQYRKAFLANDIQGYKIKIFIVGIGNVYDKLTLKSIVEEHEGHFLALDDAVEFDSKIKEIFKENNGEEDSSKK